MKRTKLTLMLLVIISALLALSCGESSSEPGVYSDPGSLTDDIDDPRVQGLDSDGIFEFQTEDNDGNMYDVTLYVYWSVVGKDKIDRFRSDDRYAADIQSLLADNYMYNPLASKYYVITDADNVTINIWWLAFVQDTPADVASFAALRYGVGADKSDVYQFERTVYGAYPIPEYWEEGGFVTQVNIGEWTQSYEPIKRRFTNDAKGAPCDSIVVDPEGWDWKLWAKCVAEGSLSGCAAGHGACMWSSDPYDDCVEDECGRAFAGSIARCTWDQLW